MKLIALMLIAVCCAGTAQVEERYATGECPNGGTWSSVTIIEDGRVLLVYGVDCDGHDYAKVLCSDSVEHINLRSGGDKLHEESDQGTRDRD